MFRVFFREDDCFCGEAPVYVDVRVVPCDGAFALRSVVGVAFVLKHSVLRKYCESVCESFRDEKLTVVVFCEFNCNVFSVGRRAFADVDCDVEDTAFDYAYELCLGVWRFLEMKASDHAVAGPAFVVLDEAGVADLFYEFSFGEGFEEVAAAVAEDFRFQDQYAGDFGLDYVHISLFVIYNNEPSSGMYPVSGGSCTPAATAPAPAATASASHRSFSG